MQNKDSSMEHQIKPTVEKTPYLLILPAVIFIFCVMIYPLGKVFYLALQNYNPTMPFANGFCGLDNFRKIFSAGEFYQSLVVSAKWVVAEVFLQLVFGMVIALLLNQRFKMRGLFRAVIFIPWAMSGVLTAVLFGLIFNQSYGVLNDLLTKMGLIQQNIAWLANVRVVLGSVIVAELWRGVPFFAISLLAAMQGFPQDIYEAARVDGCNKIRTFHYITLPLLKDTIILTTLLRTIWEFNSVDLIYTLTGGGPVGKTTTLSILIANQALTTNNYGYGSAMSVISFFLLTIIAAIYIKATGFGKESSLS
jgi:multiple sugar transport system permease protein